MSDNELRPCAKCGHDVYEHSSGGCHHRMVDGYYCGCAVSIQELMQKEIDMQAAKIERLRGVMDKALSFEVTKDGLWHESQVLHAIQQLLREALKGGGE